MPAIAVSAARGIVASPALVARLGARLNVRPPVRERRLASWLVPVLAFGGAVSLFVPSFTTVRAAGSSTTKFSSLAGTGGVPRGREAGQWVSKHVPQGAELMTVGPSMANILEFYGRRSAYGLSISPNPLNRNPSYKPIINPDRAIRNADLQYLVWDAYSANRSKFFARSIVRYADRYNGRVVHTESVMTTDSSGALVRKPVIIIYQVRP